MEVCHVHFRLSGNLSTEASCRALDKTLGGGAEMGETPSEPTSQAVMKTVGLHLW